MLICGLGRDPNSGAVEGAAAGGAQRLADGAADRAAEGGAGRLADRRQDERAHDAVSGEGVGEEAGAGSGRIAGNRKA